MRKIAAVLVLLAGALAAQDRVRAIQPPATMLPSEPESAGITHFSFVVYGDTRSGIPPVDQNQSRDGEIVQVEHSAIVDSILAMIGRLRGSDREVRFVIQSGDAVARGQNAKEWDVSYTPIINRLTQQGNVPYFLAAGNHDVTAATTHSAPGRQLALKNTLDAVSNLIPPDGTPRRLAGYLTYAFGFGNSFFLTLDSNLIGDETQFRWVQAQLEGLDRARYPHVFVFFHQNVFSSGRHGGPRVEAATTEMRIHYMPLFREQHVEAVFSGHEHLLDHYVEHYRDESGEHAMELIVSGGGGAPTMTYTGEPDTATYEQQNNDHNVHVEHLMQPGKTVAENPNHYLLVTVEGEQVTMEVVAPGMPTYQPYRSNQRTISGRR
jgi:3',5'-cyclic AMP phosphodiesterase CpdA